MENNYESFGGLEPIHAGIKYYLYFEIDSQNKKLKSHLCSGHHPEANPIITTFENESDLKSNKNNSRKLLYQRLLLRLEKEDLRQYEILKWRYSILSR